MNKKPAEGKWISNYVFVEGKKLTNHLVAVNRDSQLVTLTSLLNELANTEYVPQALCVVPRRLKRRLQSVFDRSDSIETFEREFARAFTGTQVQGCRVFVAAADFESGYLDILNH